MEARGASHLQSKRESGGEGDLHLQRAGAIMPDSIAVSREPLNS
jgi:hypothetical protein